MNQMAGWFCSVGLKASENLFITDDVISVWLPLAFINTYQQITPCYPHQSFGRSIKRHCISLALTTPNRSLSCRATEIACLLYGAVFIDAFLLMRLNHYFYEIMHLRWDLCWSIAYDCISHFSFRCPSVHTYVPHPAELVHAAQWQDEAAGLMDRLKDERIDGRTDGQTDRRTEISSWVLQDFVPYRVYCPACT